MEKLFADYGSIQWWHNTVFWPSILIFVSWAVFKGLDHFAKKFPESMNQWGSKIHQNFVATVALLEQNPDAKALYAMRSLWLNLRALLKLAAMIVCIYLAYSDVPSNWHWQQWLVFFVGIVFFVRAGNDHNKASSINRAIRRATPVLDQLEALE